MRFGSIISSLLVAMCSTTATAAEQAFYGKTFVVWYSVQGSPLSFRFYVSGDGTLFAYSNYGKRCSGTGSFTKLNSSNTSRNACEGPAGRVTRHFDTSAALSGNTLEVEQRVRAVYGSGSADSHITYRTAFSYDGKSCQAISYRANGDSFAPLRCSVQGGNTATRNKQSER